MLPATLFSRLPQLRAPRSHGREAQAVFDKASAAHQRAKAHQQSCKAELVGFDGLESEVARHTVEALRSEAGRLRVDLTDALRDSRPKCMEFPGEVSTTGPFSLTHAPGGSTSSSLSRSTGSAATAVLGAHHWEKVRRCRLLAEYRSVSCPRSMDF
jgi:hypothetical protein